MVIIYKKYFSLITLFLSVGAVKVYYVYILLGTFDNTGSKNYIFVILCRSLNVNFPYLLFCVSLFVCLYFLLFWIFDYYVVSYLFIFYIPTKVLSKSLTCCCFICIQLGEKFCQKINLTLQRCVGTKSSHTLGAT